MVYRNSEEKSEQPCIFMIPIKLADILKKLFLQLFLGCSILIDTKWNTLHVFLCKISINAKFSVSMIFKYIIINVTIFPDRFNLFSTNSLLAGKIWKIFPTGEKKTSIFPKRS